MESSDDKKRMIESDNEQRPNKLEVSRETRFTSGSKYEGTSWNAVDKTGIGRYVTPHGANQVQFLKKRKERKEKTKLNSL